MLLDQTTVRMMRGEGVTYCSLDPGTAFILAQVAQQVAQGVGQAAGGAQQSEALSQAQKDAKDAAKEQQRLTQDLLDKQWQLIMEGADLRDVMRQTSEEQIGLLSQEAKADPGSSPLALRSIERGGENLATNLAAYGVGPDSSAFSGGLADIVGSAGALDVNRQTDIMKFLASLGPQSDPSSTGVALGGQALSANAQASNLLQNSLQSLISGGAVQGATTASTLGNIGQGIGNLPLQYQQYQLFSNINKSQNPNTNIMDFFNKNRPNELLGNINPGGR